MLNWCPWMTPPRHLKALTSCMRKMLVILNAQVRDALPAQDKSKGPLLMTNQREATPFRLRWACLYLLVVDGSAQLTEDFTVGGIG